jgi:F-type H+-transporting ATPase subunit gamma
VTRRRDIESRRRSLGEIRGIMNSMKTLAYLETRKLARRIDPQRAVIRHIESTARELLAAHPGLLPDGSTGAPICVVIGSERGFCGDFNQALLLHANELAGAAAPLRILVGRKLHGLAPSEDRVAARIDGAGVAGEVSAVLDRIVAELGELQAANGVLGVRACYHNAAGEIVTRQVLPPFRDLKDTRPRYSHAPMLNLSPTSLLMELTDHYVFAALHELLYLSLMSENQWRVAHLTNAVRHLDDKSTVLTRRVNALRQEEIIEEIEVILLSAANLEDGAPRPAS